MESKKIAHRICSMVQVAGFIPVAFFSKKFIQQKPKQNPREGRLK